MRAEIEIKEVQNTYKKGWFSKGTETLYNVYPNLTLTDEEKSVLNKNNTWSRVVYTFVRNMTPMQKAAMDGETGLPISILDLAQPDYHIGFPDPIEANNFVHVLETKILPIIKGYTTASPMGKRIVDL